VHVVPPLAGGVDSCQDGPPAHACKRDTAWGTSSNVTIRNYSTHSCCCCFCAAAAVVEPYLNPISTCRTPERPSTVPINCCLHLGPDSVSWCVCYPPSFLTSGGRLLQASGFPAHLASGAAAPGHGSGQGANAQPLKASLLTVIPVCCCLVCCLRDKKLLLVDTSCTQLDGQPCGWTAADGNLPSCSNPHQRSILPAMQHTGPSSSLMHHRRGWGATA
jgi:hypothetical protein